MIYVYVPIAVQLAGDFLENVEATFAQKSGKVLSKASYQTVILPTISDAEHIQSGVPSWLWAPTGELGWTWILRKCSAHPRFGN